MSRILLLTQKLKLTATELKCIVDNQEAFDINQLSQLSIKNIQTISYFKELIAAFGDQKNQLVAYFASVYGNEENNHIEELAKITGWKSEEISLLVSPANNQTNNQLSLGRDAHKTVEGITKLKQYFSLSSQLGVNVSWFTKLLKLIDLPVAGASENWQLYQDAAQAVQEITKAKYDDEQQWVQVSEKIEGELNEHKRDVLTAWIVWNQKYQNLRHLSQELLIDVETSSEISISIIKEATLAIQTYLHRCRMGLEPGVEKLEIPETWWQWIMNYRVWEASRKIFLYPENYLDPSLRKIKTPIFQELQEELLQSDITEESVEQAYQNYFEKFTEIAQLKPAGGYRCTVENNSEAQDTLYLFGRTATEPYTYYYQKCINPEAHIPSWEPWQQIDLVINSEQISATYAFNKLFIFWVEVIQIEKKQQQGNKQETEIETKATIKYSFQKFGNQWIQPQTLAQDIVIENYNQLSNNLWQKVTALPIAANESEPEKILILFGDLSREGEFYGTQDKNQGIFLNIDLLQENTNVILENQPSNARQSTIFDSKLMAIPTDNVLYDNYADYADNSRGRYPLTGLVGYWSINEKNGNNIIDAVGNNQGTFKGNTTLERVNDFPGIDSRKVLKLDGDGDYVEFTGENASFGQFGQSNFSIGLWFKTTQLSGTIMMGPGSDSNHWRIYLENGKAKFAFNTGNLSSNHGTSSATVNDGNWHHLTAIRSNVRSGKLYLDGVLVDEFNYSGSTVNIDNVRTVFIGKNRNTDYFQGEIAEVSAWNIVLSADQIFNASIPFIPLVTKNISKSNVSIRGIDNQPGWFTFDNGDEAFLACPKQTNGFSQIDNGLRTVTQDGEIALSYENSQISHQKQLKYTFKRLNTTTIRHLSQKMLVGGLDNLLTLDSQLTPELNFNRFSPSDFVDFANSRRLDFDGPLGMYFWEIFFHIPFLVANTLNSNQRFEEAQKWYHYIFNPTNPQYIFNPTNPQYIFNPTNPNSEDLGAYFPMNEGSGTEISDLRANNNGTLEGNPQWKTVDDFPGVISRNVLEFDGENSAVKIDKSVGDFKANNFSIQLWFKTATDFGTIIRGGFPNDDYWQIYIENGFAKFGFDTGGLSGNHGSSDVTVNDGDWHHLTAVRDKPQEGKLYVDGVLVDEFSYSGTNTAINLNSNVFIGKRPNNKNYFQGQIAEVSIWNVVLSGEQIFDELVGKQSDRFWHYLPFRGNALQKIQQTLTNDGAIKAYNDNPFDPHAIAKLRIGAYEKAIVMKYIDNLLDWGDQLFAQDNRESINQATLLYFLAYDLLGEEPENLGKRPSPSPKTFSQIQAQYENEGDEIPQFLIELENRINDTTSVTITSAALNDINTYFCAPENEQFIAYWERVEDRLFKIRHSLNIEGIRRQLALFQPPIDPNQLVRAIAAGVQPLSVISQLTPAVPNYRFDNILERAKSFTSTLTQLGASLLSALEKKDAEELALLRNIHEQSILQLTTTTKEKQLEESKETLSSLEESKKSAQKRHNYYTQLIENGLIVTEQNHLEQMTIAQGYNLIGILGRTGAALAYLQPQLGSPFALTYGGAQLGAAAIATSGVSEMYSSVATYFAMVNQTIAGYERRQQEWELQRDVSEIDIEQIDKQIAAQKIRVQIAEQELKIHQENIEQAKEIEDFLKGKFTNQELYQWMVSRLSILYFQTYKIALDMAMASQSAYQYELTKDDTFINFNYWDSLKKGLLAGESLMLGLNQLEKAYIEGNVRRLEIEKTISLLQLNPLAFQQLKETGKCEFELTEKLFDFDFPGHYARLIKTISVSIPAVVGPYQNISATLTQTSNKTLLKPDVNGVQFLLGETNEIPDTSIVRSNWRRNQKIALSRGAMDNGLFELNFFWDTRYLPFEATGAVSTWELSLPKQTNRIDFDSISDVIITLSYTALDGGDTFRENVINLESLQNYSEAYYFNLKQAFPGEWHNFINLNTDTNSQKLNFQISKDIIPPHIENAKLTDVIFKLDAPDVFSNESFISLEIANGQPIEINLLSSNIASLDISSNSDFAGNWSINFDLTKVPNSLKKDGFLDPEIVNNIELILTYEGKINW